MAHDAARDPQTDRAARRRAPAGLLRGRLRLAELAEDPMVLLDAPPSSEHALDVCRQAGFAPRVAYRTENFETARAFVGAGSAGRCSCSGRATTSRTRVSRSSSRPNWTRSRTPWTSSSRGIRPRC
ncbi:LysR substrate-binding domain-containing protein [Prauserella oleivorans]